MASPNRRKVLPEKEEYIDFLVFVAALLAILTFYFWLWRMIF